MTVALVAASAGVASAANDPGYPQQWGMRLIGAESAWSTATGKGITIAVVDTGVFLQHEDLKDKLVVLPGSNFVTAGASPADDYGHGTHVAGIAAAETNNNRGVVGVAPDAKIMPVKVLDNTGSGDGNAVDAGIRFAVDHGAQIVNLSLGSDIQGVPVVGGPSFADAIDYAWSKGVICVVAAGNSFVTGSGFANEPALVVSAVDRNDQKPDYSSSVGQAKWGIAAPGGADPNTDPKTEDGVFSSYWDVNHPSTTNTYADDAGTSMAAPHVAGAAALLRSLGLTPQQTVDRLLATAKDIGTAGNDSTFGHGRLDVAKAVAGLGPTGGTPTTGASSTRTTAKAGTATTGVARSGTASASGSVAAPVTSAPGGTVPTSPPGQVPAVADASRPESAADSLHVVRARSRHSSSRPWAAAGVAIAMLVAVAAGAVLLRPRPTS